MSKRRRDKRSRISTHAHHFPTPVSTTWYTLFKVAAVVVTLIATGIFFSMTKDLGLVGWDTYPLIITSRVQSFSDFLGNFTDALMKGRYEGGFYRPVLNLSIALNYALCGLKPFGYQLINVLLFAGCALSLYFLVERLVGSRSLVAPLAALIFFLLHPTHYEVIPVPARRPEALCCTFMALSLLWQLSHKSLALRRPPLMPALLALFAIASKETAFILPVLAFVAVLLYSPRQTIRARMMHATTALIPHSMIFIAMLAVRTLILGGIAGHQPTRVLEVFNRFPHYAQRISELLFFPQPVMHNSFLGKWITMGLLAGVILSLLLPLLSKQGTTKGWSNRQLLCAFLFALSWLLMVTLACAAAGKVESWYMFLPVAGLAILVGSLTELLREVVRKGDMLARVVTVSTLSLLVTFMLWQGRYSPLVYNYDEWERATSASTNFLEELRGKIENATDGETLFSPPVPVWVNFRKDRPFIRGASVLSDYSIQAWVELTFPERRVLVRQIEHNRTYEYARDEVLVLLTNRLEGY